MSRIENIGCMQESRALHADVDECRLHPRQYARYAALVNIADQSAAAGALQKYFLQNAVFHDGGAGLVRAGIDEHITAHAAANTLRRPPSAAPRVQRAAIP